jgi:hypothetical protein
LRAVRSLALPMEGMSCICQQGGKVHQKGRLAKSCSRYAISACAYITGRCSSSLTC